MTLPTGWQLCDEYIAPSDPINPTNPYLQPDQNPNHSVAYSGAGLPRQVLLPPHGYNEQASLRRHPGARAHQAGKRACRLGLVLV